MDGGKSVADDDEKSKELEQPSVYVCFCVANK